jgi:hypothetical protein
VKPLFVSVCLLKASNSEFESIGFGEAAAKEKIEEVGGLQFSFGPTPESRESIAGSGIIPK